MSVLKKFTLLLSIGLTLGGQAAVADQFTPVPEASYNGQCYVTFFTSAVSYVSMSCCTGSGYISYPSSLQTNIAMNSYSICVFSAFYPDGTYHSERISTGNCYESYQ